MAVVDEKARLAGLLNTTHQEAVVRLQGVDPYRMIYAKGGWRVKDIIAHITAWEEAMALALQAHQQNREYSLNDCGTDDECNEIIFQERKNRSPEQVYAEWQAVRHWLIGLANDLTDEQFAEKFLFPWGERQTVTYLIEHDLIPHMRDHLDDIKKALDPMNRLRLGLLFILLVGVPLAAAQDVISPALDKQLDDIEVATSQSRGLDAKSPVERRFPTRAEVRAFLKTSLDESLPDDLAFREAQFYAAFDWLPGDTDLRGLYDTLLGDQVAGYYDTDTQTMNVIPIDGKPVGDKLGLLDQITYSHEYTHALQDQHFDLDRLIGSQESLAGDQLLAVQALIEGDATYVMQEYTLIAAQRDPFGSALQLLNGNVLGTTLPPGIPLILQHELLFPYLDGMSFVGAVWQNGGWDKVNAAYRDLPQSTEQILHPEKYLKQENPVEVTLRPATLNNDWTLLIDRTLGEFYLREYLRTQLPASEANAAAAGWGGDHFYLFTNAATQQRAWVMWLVWDSAADTTEFDKAYQMFGDKRIKDTTYDGACWSSQVETLCAITYEQGSLLSYAPTRELAQQLFVSQEFSGASS